MWSKALPLQRAAILSKVGVSFYPRQLEVIRSDRRIRLVVGGERAGKSFISAMDLLSRLPWGREFWLIGPDYYLPRAEFEYIVAALWRLDAIRSKRDISKPKEGSWSLRTKSGQLVVTRTSADVRKLAARPIDGIILCEAGQQSYDVFLKAVGRVSEPRGFILASGTFESSYDWYASTFREWIADVDDADGKAFSLPTWENSFIFPGGRQDSEILRLEKLYSGVPGYFDEKCGAVPAPPLGVIFREFSYRTHLSDAATYDSRLPVYLGIDPGHGGPSAYAIVACQFVASSWPGKEDPIDLCKVIDIIYIAGADFDTIRPIVASRMWFPNVSGGAIDVEAPDERKRWRRYLGVSLVSKKVLIAEGERRLHTFLKVRGLGGEHLLGPGTPPIQGKQGVSHLLIAPTCSPDALKEFTQYRSPIQSPEELEGRPPSTVRQRRGPEHFLKALWYLLIARYGVVKLGHKPSPIVRGAWRRLRGAFR